MNDHAAGGTPDGSADDGATGDGAAGAGYDLADARARDETDPLADYRGQFAGSADLYMDGNSLGLASKPAVAAVESALEEWKELAIRGWEAADPEWFTYGERLGDLLAPLLGVRESEAVVANATTVNVHTLLGTFLDTLPGTPAGPDPSAEPPAILVNELDFPTDHYAIRAQLRQRGIDPDDKLVQARSDDGRTITPDAVADALDRRPDVGIVFMPAVLYRSGQLLDVERITALAHAHDALAGFDCAHSIGVVDHDLRGADVDFGVWCSYKYLNSGPGATAGLYVHERHHGLTPALAGWWGHEKETQFEMRQTFTPASDAGAYQIGTVPVLSTAPIRGAAELVREAGIDRIREKSLALTDYLIRLIDERLPDAFTVGTPREQDRRGGHVAIEHPEGYRLSEALRDRDVVVDFRPPNVVRVCPSPLYTSFEDVWRVVEQLRTIAADRVYEQYDPPAGGVT